MNADEPSCTCAKHRRVTGWVNCAEFDALVEAGVVDKAGQIMRPELLLDVGKQTHS